MSETKSTSRATGGTTAGQPPAEWPAPLAEGAVTAEVRLPGSKSLTNRYLVLAALADGRVVFANTLFSCLAEPSEGHSFAPVWRPP